MRKAYILLLVVISCASYSQNLSIKGKVVDAKSQSALEAATIYMTRISDSTVIDYTITDKNGNFQLNTKLISKPLFLKVSYVGYEQFMQRIESISENIDMNIVRLKEIENKIGEVVVISEAPPVRIKNDTLEFNASSFKLRPDANVETLLKQLPGVEIDNDGKITVNGKEVNQILVNGKPFFDKDGKIALQNLPSDIINKIQVTDSKTKQEEITGTPAASNAASINLKIDEEKNKGFFGKVMGGYGSDKRYESSLLLNYFKNKRKISVLASANNINSTGFSMNEIFDNMGGGRNRSVYVSDDGGFGINGMQFGGGAGITQSYLAGVNYADELFKGFDINGSYFYTDADSKNTNRSRTVTFLDNDSFTTNSHQVTDDYKFAHNANFSFEYKIDSTMSLYITPKLVKAHSSYSRVADESSISEGGRLLNENTASSDATTDNDSYSTNIFFNKDLKKKHRSFDFYFDNENNRENAFSLNRSNSFFYDDFNNDGVTDLTTVDDRDQMRLVRNLKDNYHGGIDYFEPIMDSVRFKIAFEYRNNALSKSKTTYDFNPASQEYSNLNAEQSNYSTSVTKTFIPNVGFNIETSKLYVGLNLGTAITKFDNNSLYLGNYKRVLKNYIYPSANAWMSYNFSKSKSANVSYEYTVTFPNSDQVLPVTDLSDPLRIFIGNPDLVPNRGHQLWLSFRNYDYATKSGYSFYGGGNYNDSQVVSSTTYDESRKSTTRYLNVKGTLNSWFGINWNKSIKKEANSYKIALRMNAGFDKDKGFTNGIPYEASRFSLSPRVNFTYDYGELLSITPNYSINWNKTSYSNNTIDAASALEHKFNLQFTSYWPKHVVFGTDVSYTYNTNIADGFKKDFYLVNTSLGYNFFKDKLLAKVKVYDLLDQNQSTSRTIGSTYIRDEENVVLKRYLMFSLTYKFDKFGTKKEENKDQRWF